MLFSLLFHIMQSYDLSHHTVGTFLIDFQDDPDSFVPPPNIVGARNLPGQTSGSYFSCPKYPQTYLFPFPAIPLILLLRCGTRWIVFALYLRTRCRQKSLSQTTDKIYQESLAAGYSIISFS